jgi:hypothetical protein
VLVLAVRRSKRERRPDHELVELKPALVIDSDERQVMATEAAAMPRA